MEISIDEVRGMIGGYILEITVKDKEIAQLKAKLAELEKPKENAITPIRSIEPREYPSV